MGTRYAVAGEFGERLDSVELSVAVVRTVIDRSGILNGVDHGVRPGPESAVGTTRPGGLISAPGEEPSDERAGNHAQDDVHKDHGDSLSTIVRQSSRSTIMAIP